MLKPATELYQLVYLYRESEAFSTVSYFWFKIKSQHGDRTKSYIGLSKLL